MAGFLNPTELIDTAGDLPETYDPRNDELDVLSDKGISPKGERVHSPPSSKQPGFTSFGTDKENYEIRPGKDIPYLPQDTSRDSDEKLRNN